MGPVPRLVVLALLSATVSRAQESAELVVAATLDRFHLAAAEAHGEIYFGMFAPGAVFLGTDASERWSVEQFRAFAEPHFSEGRGWAYVASQRHVTVDEGGQVAWFDERLQNVAYGEVRGSGVLRRIDGEWKIAQYNLAIPVPNDLAGGLVKQIQATQESGEVQGLQHFAVAESGEVAEKRIALWEKVLPETLELPPAERPVVVLVPHSGLSARGLFDLPLEDYSLMDALARRGLDVFAVDQAVAAGPLEPGEALLAVLDKIEALRGQRKVALVGLGGGAWSAVGFANLYPDRLHGLALYGFASTGRPFATYLEEFFDVGPSGPAEFSCWEQRRESLVAAVAKGELEPGFAEFYGGGLEPRSLPVLMIWGRQDPIMSNEGGRQATRRLYALFDGPKHWVEIPGAHYLAHLDEHYRLFQLCLAGWIERLPE